MLPDSAPTQKTSVSPASRTRGTNLLALSLTALAALFLWRVRESLLPFLVALLIAVVLDPTLKKLEARGWPRRRSVPLLYILLLSTTLLILFVGIPILSEQTTNLLANFSFYVKRAQSSFEELRHTQFVKRIPTAVRQPIEQQISHAAQFVPQAINRVTTFLFQSISSVLTIVITLLATFYLLLDLPKIRESLLTMAPPAHREKIREIVADVSGVFSAYLRGLLNVSLLYSLAVTALLLGFKTPNAVAIGVMAGILYMVPYLGALLTVLVGGLATLLLDGTARALTVSFLLLLTNQLFDYIITPRIMQRHVGLPPLANIFALVTAGTMFGLPGVLLAVPVAASLMVVLQNLYPRLLGVPSATEPKPAEGAGPEPAP